MHTNGKTDIADLKKLLQKTFSVIKQYRKTIKETEAVAGPCIKTVVNLTEQFQCCSNVSVTSLPSNIDFSEVKQKLLYKISSEITENIIKLQGQISSYEEYSNRIGNLYDQCLSTCNRLSSTEEFQQLLTRSALCPSVTDMLEWVEISERLIRETYLCKKFTIDTYTPDQPEICDDLEKCWQEGSRHLNTQLDEFLALTSNFMESEVL